MEHDANTKRNQSQIRYCSPLKVLVHDLILQVVTEFLLFIAISQLLSPNPTLAVGHEATQ